MTDIQKGPFLRVVSGGQTTSLQDRGRFGFQDKGVPPSGVLNQNAMKIVNKLVGNNIEDAVLEIGLIPMPLSSLISHPNSDFRNLFKAKTSSEFTSSSLPE